MLPQLYTLETVPVVGHLGHTVPTSINCPECGRELKPYQEIELVLDLWPKCDLVAAKGNAYFISDSFLSRLQDISGRGYAHYPAIVNISDDFRRAYPSIIEIPSELQRFYYFVVTGRCDGPWTRNIRAELCTTCGQRKSRPKNFNALASEIIGDAPIQPTLVFTETWQGDDFFFVSEPGPPLITERIALILKSTGNLRIESVADRVLVSRLMPKYAKQLEKQNWQQTVCCSLGPAGWTSTLE